jgi:hypothetical protein
LIGFVKKGNDVEEPLLLLLLELMVHKARTWLQ